MTLQEAGKQYDIVLYYSFADKDNIIPDGWSWSVECGYQTFSSKGSFNTAAEAEENLIKFLETWEGPTK